MDDIYVKLISNIKDSSLNDLETIIKAYELANKLHEGQFRQSGEPYINHPLEVAYILSEMNADSDTICAALLHDVLEDSDISKEELSKEFNETVAELIDGVTKISKLNFADNKEANMANTRKIITSITKDVRIIIIKLADRLHNMRTMEHKEEFKQKENSLETMEIFVPLAYYIGAYRIKTELEDLSLKYLKPDMYKKLEKKKIIIEKESEKCLTEMLETIGILLESHNIPYEIKVRAKNIYGIYKRVTSGDKLYDIHDLLSLKIMVENISQCYQALGLIHSKYRPINDKFKDYICNHKTNMYKSLHTTVFGSDEHLVQTQIRTFKMDKVASFGLTAYWDLKNNNAREEMQKDLTEKFQFFESLSEINIMCADNQEFVRQVKTELFADRIYIYTPKGEIIELPKGATPIDLAYKIHTDIGNTMIGVLVNNENVPVDYKLQNKDIVRIITDELSYGPREEWVPLVVTSTAKRRIKEFRNTFNEVSG